MKYERAKTAVWWAVIALTVLFIWGQSLLGRELSRLQSESVQGFLGSLLGERVYTTFLYRNIRKVAHFAEYALLGMEWMGYRLSVRGSRRPTWWALCAVGPAVAVCDELLQFVSARAPRVTDVLLDCGGYVCGAAAVFGVAWLWQRCCRQKSVAE
jgi:VanZ family protein